MSWYNLGTVTLTTGSAIVDGAGTAFVGNVTAGQALLTPDGRLMEIAEVISSTRLRLVRVYAGGSVGGVVYDIIPTSADLTTVIERLNTLITRYRAVVEGIGQGLLPDGTQAAPALRFLADQDTGARRHSADIGALVSGGVDRLLWSSDGIDVAGRIIGAAADTVGVAQPVLGQPPSGVSAFLTNASRGYGLLFGHYGTTGDSWVQAQRVDGDGRAYNLNLQPSGGRVGIGTTTPGATLQLGDSLGVFPGIAIGAQANRDIRIGQAPDRAVLFGWKYSADLSSAYGFIETFAGNHNLALQTAGGNLLVGVTSGASHVIDRAAAEQTPILIVSSRQTGVRSAMLYAVSGTDTWAGSGAALYLNRHAGTGRSLNAGGTINAGGADYAEYMVKADGCGTIDKGDVCGVDRDGRLTKTWADAISFVIKSTDPSYVGGDIWGRSVGPRPEGPGEEPSAPIAPPAAPASADEADVAAWRAIVAAYPAQQSAHQSAHAAWATAKAAYDTALPAWEAALEVERQKVDRIAFAGQVPVNVSGDFAVGDYIIAAASGAGITAVAVPAEGIPLDVYLRRVGKVWAVRDGRAWVDVQHG